jgi:hypothetical protein
MGAAVYSITNLQLKYIAFSKIRELKVSGRKRVGQFSKGLRMMGRSVRNGES